MTRLKTKTNKHFIQNKYTLILFIEDNRQTDKYYTLPFCVVHLHVNNSYYKYSVHVRGFTTRTTACWNMLRLSQCGCRFVTRPLIGCTLVWPRSDSQLTQRLKLKRSQERQTQRDRERERDSRIQWRTSATTRTPGCCANVKCHHTVRQYFTKGRFLFYRKQILSQNQVIIF